MNYMKGNLHIVSRTALFLLTAVLVFSGCKKQTATDLDPQTAYFGLEKGTFVEYEVTYMFHDSLLHKHDTLHYQIRTEVADTVIDNSGRVVRKFFRYKRDNASQPWMVKDLWTAVIDGNRAELVEENQRMVKLVFRPSDDKKWDINAFNNLGEMVAKYSGIGEAREINGLSFPKTVTVEQESYTTLIDTRRKYEVYAEGVGMIQKYYRDLDYKFGSPAPIKGEEYFYNVINYGIQ